ncbi:MAG: DNA primase [bacterium]
MIPQDTIEQIRQAVDIVQIIGEYLKLKKRGSRYLALCPFHTEKTPSFSISSEKQLYYCFGCGKGGTVFTFLMEHEGMSYVEAIKYLAGKVNIPIKEDSTTDFKRELNEKIYFANQVALEYFKKQLLSSKYKHILNDYLIKKRGITKEIIEEYSLGLVGEEWEGLIKFASSKDLSPKDLFECGLAIYSEKNKSYFDRFRQRLMIPIFNLSQKPIAFGGRTLKKGEPAKYINSPESSIYIKGNVLYNLNLAKDHIKQMGSAIITEGYFDVISLWQAGTKNVVASSGTAFTLQQARLLARFTDKVCLFFDADSAGRKAALRSVDSLYDAGLEVKVIIAPPGEDPDSIARDYGADKLNELINNAMNFINFRIQDVDLRESGIIAREKLVKELGALGNKISDPTRRSLFHTEASNVLGVDVELLRNVPEEKSYSPESKPQRPKQFNKVETGLLSLLFNNPGTIDIIFEQVSPDDFESKELSRLYSAIANQYKTAGVVNAGVLIDTVRDQGFISLITKIASEEWEADVVDYEANNHLKMFHQKKQERIREKLKQDLVRAEAEGNVKEAENILAELKKQGL